MKKQVIITAVASAAAALVSGVAVRIYHKVKYGLLYKEMLENMENIGRDCELIYEKLGEMQCDCGCEDFDDYIFEEDNEDD